jgi:hypothetical protein
MAYQRPWHVNLNRGGLLGSFPLSVRESCLMISSADADDERDTACPRRSLATHVLAARSHASGHCFLFEVPFSMYSLS